VDLISENRVADLMMVINVVCVARQILGFVFKMAPLQSKQ
jgi:hypothetical protein